jgi:predicted PurR-regulated permease PerM
MNSRIISARIYALAIVVPSAWILHGFVHGLLVATVAAIASWPLYARFAARLPGRLPRSTAPALFASLMTVFVLAPMLFAIWALIGEAETVVREILVADVRGIAAPTWLVELPLLGPWAAARWQRELAHPTAGGSERSPLSHVGCPRRVASQLRHSPFGVQSGAGVVAG